jgi:hypothetical protein
MMLRLFVLNLSVDWKFEEKADRRVLRLYLEPGKPVVKNVYVTDRNPSLRRFCRPTSG